MVLTLNNSGFLSGMSKAEGAAKGGGSSIMAAAAGPIGIIAAVAGSMVALAGAANPALFAKLQDTFDDLFATIGEMFVPVLETIIPLVRLFADVMAALAPTVKLLVEVFMIQLRVVTYVLQQLAGLLGLKSSVGAGAKQGSFGSAESFADKAYLSAFSGAGGGGDTAFESLKWLERIGIDVRAVLDFIRNPGKGLMNLISP